jgi:hypothetical protein
MNWFHSLHAYPHRTALQRLAGLLLLLSLLAAPFVATVRAQEAAPLKPLPVLPAPTPEPAAPPAAPELAAAPSIDGAQVRFATSDAAGTPASFVLPDAPQLQGATLAAPASRDDWHADIRESFEHHLAGWQVRDASDNGVELFWGIDNTTAYSGTRSAWMAAGGTNARRAGSGYPGGLDSWLVSNYHLDLSTAAMADVEFAMRVETRPDIDFVFVGASIDGETYVGEYWSGTSGGWQTYRMDLSDFVGHTNVSLAWYFHSAADSDSDAGGVWLDAVSVWTYEETEQMRVQEAVRHGDFEGGSLSGWATPAESTVIAIQAPNPISGAHVAYLGGIPQADELLYQPVAFPDHDVRTARLGFWVNLFGSETVPDADRFCARLLDARLEEVLLDLGCLDGTTAASATFHGGQWQQVDIDLQGERWYALRGQTANLVFTMQTDGERSTSVLVDDVTLKVTTGGTSSDPAEPNNLSLQAASITLGEPLADLTIDPAGDEDWFRVTGNAGDELVIDIDTDSTSTLDALVSVINDRGAEVCRNDDDGISSDPYLRCTLPTSGTYYAQVRSYDGRGSRSARYQITIGSGDTAPEAPAPAPAPTPAPDAERAWTAMLYLSGDNNLCDTYPYLIKRMERDLVERIGPDGFLTVAVLFDGNSGYCPEHEGTTRFVVQPGAAYQDGLTRWDMGELDMGDPDTLVNFATWAMDNYPAQHYYLAIDNHGGGFSGISWDDTSGHRNISTSALRGALKQITNDGQRRIDVLAYEACLMGLYELAYDMREFVDYLFFFQTISWTNSASYPSYLEHSRFSATADGLDLGKIMFEVYYENVSRYYAVSLIDTSQIEHVQAAINEWADALQALAGTSRDDLAAARQETQKINQYYDTPPSNTDAYIDLWHLTERMEARGLAVPQSAALRKALDAAIVSAASHSSGAFDYSQTHGLSIFWPHRPYGEYRSYMQHKLSESTRDGTWDDFLQTYYASEDASGLPTQNGPAQRPPQKVSIFGQSSLYLPLVHR